MNESREDGEWARGREESGWQERRDADSSCLIQTERELNIEMKIISSRFMIQVN